MSTKHLINTLAEVIKVVDNLKAIKKIEEYTELSSNITFKGEDTGKEFVITVKINEDDKIEIDGDVSFINIIKDVIGDYYGVEKEI